MKKSFLVLALFVCAVLTVQAQEAGKFRFGIGAGVNFSNLNYEADHSGRTGYNVGIRTDYSITDNLYLGAALNLTQKGCKIKDESDIKLSPTYIELPIHVGYRYAISENLSLFGEAGPYFAYGIMGKAKNEYEDVDVFDIDGIKKFDMGIGAAIGAEFVKHVQVRLGYDYGLTGFNDADPAPKHSNFHVGLAYMF